MEEQKNQVNERGGLPVLLKVMAALSLLLGIIAAVNIPVHDNGFWEEERSTAGTILWAASGVLSAVFWWALSNIVEAAQKYICKR